MTSVTDVTRAIITANKSQAVRYIFNLSLESRTIIVRQCEQVLRR
jgi:hypothetical protein